MNRCKDRTVIYRARSYFPHGEVDWYLAWDDSSSDRRWRWVKDAERQASFTNLNAFIEAVADAGGPDRNDPRAAPGGWKGTRRVILQTITEEEEEITPSDHTKWKNRRSRSSP